MPDPKAMKLRIATAAPAVATKRLCSFLVGSWKARSFTEGCADVNHNAEEAEEEGHHHQQQQ